MIKWIKNEIACIRILYGLKRVASDYNVILLQISRLREISETLGDIGQDIRRDAEKAENQCRNCLHRFNAVEESLRDWDFRYINHQLHAASKQAKIFEESAQRVRADARKLASYINQKDRRQ